MREVSRFVGASLSALLAVTAGCGSDDKLTGDPLDQTQGQATASDGGAKSGSGKSDGGGSSTSANPKNDAGVSGGGKDAATPGAADNCGKSGFSTGAVIPDMLIVLDRSGSMKPAGNTVTLRCDGTPDFATSLACSIAGIDCTLPAYAMTTNCGGTQTTGPVDRWDPSVKAIESLTSMFDTSVSFGLMTFPAASNQCGPGDFKVPIGLGTSGAIAKVLNGMQPGGGTPTGETLQAALTSFQANAVGADTVAPTQYVLLVTDGQPTCPNANGGGGGGKNGLQADLKFTLDALDALHDAGIKTFVVGYDASLDATFADALTQMAVHGGTDNYFPVQNENSLTTAFQSISQKVVTCSFDFKTEVDDPRLVHVTLDGTTLKPDDANGWVINGKTITVQGTSCTTLQGGQGHRVEIVMECEPVVYI